MKRVLHVVDAFLARSEVFIYTYVSAHRRFEATVLCRGRENESEFPFPRVQTVGEARTRLDPAWWMSRTLQGVTGRSLWQRRAATIVERLGPDVIHAHFGPNGCAMLPIAKAVGVPLITSFYGADICVLPRLPQWRHKYAALFAGGDRFLAEGPEMRRKVLAAGCDPSRTDIQRIAIAVDRYPAWAPSDGPPQALFVGRFVEKKGLVYAVEAMARARRRLPGLTMRVIGTGPELEGARQIVAREGIDEAVTFLGMQPHASVVEELRRAHVLIHPSVVAEDGDSEGGAPTILLEAQAVGTPIVSTRHADIPNVLVQQPAVRLCPERDVEALADALIDVIASGARTDAAFVRAHHHIDREIVALEAQYDAVNALSLAV